jgi:SET and MYND domain-containing protein
VQSFDGSQLTLRALRPLSEGEEVTIAYIEMAATRQERRSSLLESYFFDIDGPKSQPGPLPLARDCAEKGSSAAANARVRTLELETGITVGVFSGAEGVGWRMDEVDSALTQISGARQRRASLSCCLAPCEHVPPGSLV